MSNYIESRGAMTEAEWQEYEKHLAKRADEERERIKSETEHNRMLRKSEIQRILRDCGGRFSREELARKPLDSLMMIF